MSGFAAKVGLMGGGDALRRGLGVGVRGVVGLLAAVVVAGCTGGRGAAVEPLGVGGLIPGPDVCLCAKVDDRVFFDFDSARLRPEGLVTLTKQANWLQRYPKVDVLVAGNSDERGTEEYNLALGFRRARAARDFLVARGVAAGRIAVISYGKEHPFALGDDETAWANNRNAITSVRP
jgi:peptidoglycan-associated lipoprotein